MLRFDIPSLTPRSGIVVLLLLILDWTPCLSQGRPLSLPGWAIVDTQSYIGKQLYGYINGGAELYHEYGFVRVDVTRMKKDGFEVTAEVYEMRDARAAYAINTLHAEAARAGKEPARTRADNFMEFVRGSRWIRLLLAPADSSGRILNELTRMVKVLYPEDNYHPAALLSPAAGFTVFGSRRLLLGPLAVQNTLPEYEKLLDGVDRYELDVIDVVRPDAVRLIAHVRFPESRLRDRFLANLRMESRPASERQWTIVSAGPVQQAVRLSGELELYYVEADTAYAGFARVLKSVRVK